MIGLGRRVLNMEKFEVKKLGVKNLVLLLIAGVLLLLCTLPDMFRQRQRGNTTDGTPATENVVGVSAVLTDEERLEALLNQVEGVGQVKSMIFTKGAADKTIEGIVIVAEGADNGKTAGYILDAAEALFGIPKHKIIVLPMKKDNGSN